MALSDVVYWLRVWGLSFALGISTLKVVTILPPATDISITKRFLPESFSNYWPGVTLHEIVDFLVIFPFAVVSLKLVYAFGTPAYSTMRDFLLCTVVRTLLTHSYGLKVTGFISLQMLLIPTFSRELCQTHLRSFTTLCTFAMKIWVTPFGFW
jgi:hypothetical protein